MLLYVLIAVAVIVVLFVIVVVLRPADFRITRSATISSSPATVFEQVNDLHKWQEWSPWAKLDPAVKNSFAGSPAGIGAAFSWSGNNEVGEGTMTITESRPSDLVRFRLEFRRPFKGTNIAEFTFQPRGDQTVVTWSMSGTNGFIGKALGLIMNCDKMVGGQFEKGLANLNSVVQATGKK